ncbi:MAG: carboxypeptidase-like regulatory domain-containing protein [Bryobacteraceae bacterium]
MLILRHVRGSRVSTPLLSPLVFSVIFFLSTVGALAQNTSSGTIAGQITDESGAAVPGADVRLVDKATNSTKGFQTNETGRYNIFDLDPGTCDISINKPGFSETRIPAQTVQVGLVLTLNVSLHLGQTSTMVEVAAVAGAELQTTNATVGSTISGAQLENLPNLGRDANALFLLQPGGCAQWQRCRYGVGSEPISARRW